MQRYFHGPPKIDIHRLQLIQNAAACILTGTKKNLNIKHSFLGLCTGYLVKIEYILKILIFAYKASNGLAPQHIGDMLISYILARSLTSRGSGNLVIPCTSSRAGEAAFCIYAPVRWNALPVDLREAPALNTFKSRLKPSFFHQPMVKFLLCMTCVYVYVSCFVLVFFEKYSILCTVLYNFSV